MTNQKAVKVLKTLKAFHQNPIQFDPPEPAEAIEALDLVSEALADTPRQQLDFESAKAMLESTGVYNNIKLEPDGPISAWSMVTDEETTFHGWETPRLLMKAIMADATAEGYWRGQQDTQNKIKAALGI